MKTAIIGSGITGSILAKEIPNSILFEKSNKPGGRASQHQFSTGDSYDIGATVLKRKIQYIQDHKKYDFDLIDYFQKNLPDLELSPMKHRANTYYPSFGMKTLFESILKDRTVKFDYELESIQLQEGLWKLNFLNGYSDFFDAVVLTQPISQSLACLKNSGLLSFWEEFSSRHCNYRTCLVSTGLWNTNSNLNAKLKNLDYTYYEKDNDAEYISIESNKYRYKNFILSVQFSSAFSSRNLERWISEDKTPSSIASSVSLYFFKEIFKKLNISELDPEKPAELRVKKWRYSIIENPIMNKDFLNLDLDKWMECIQFSKKYNLWILGDWIWGSRMVNSVLMASYISKLINNEEVL